MKTQEQVEAEIARLKQQENDSFKLIKGCGTALACVAVNMRNSIRIAALEWVLDQEK